MTYTITAEELTALEQHLTALQNNNDALKAILATQGDELAAALNLLTESQNELTKLKAELQTARTETQNALNSLEIANQELQKASVSFKQYERERDKTERRIRSQRNIWEALCVVAIGVAVAK